MKLPFFKKKSTLNFSENNSDYVQETILKRFESGIVLPKESVAISYLFTCDSGRKGENFAAKLAEHGDTVYYCAIKKGIFQINGKTEKLEAKEALIKEHLLEMADKGSKFNCVLTEWSITDDGE